MSSNLETLHGAVRAVTGTSGSFGEDFLAYTAAKGVSGGTVSEAILAYAITQDATIGSVGTAFARLLDGSISITPL